MKKKVKFQAREYIIELNEDGSLLIDDEKFEPTISNDGLINFYRVTVDNEHFTIEIQGEKILVDGEEVTLTSKPYLDTLMNQKGSNVKKEMSIKAPIPGKILQILVKKEQEVQKDQELIILEAMKMRNRILAPRDGKVKKILVKENDSVNQDQQMVILE